MKISELSYQTVVKMLGNERFNMHYDASDALREIRSEKAFIEARDELMSHFGDVELSIHPDAPWYNKVKIEDEKFKAAHREYIAEKAAWCKKYGSN